jgi:hypothetical protein
MALLSSLQDATIRSYFMLSPDQFQQELLSTVEQRFLPATKMRAYLIPGEQHTLLGKMAETTVQNVVLEGWLAGMLDDQTTWTTVQP